MKNVVFVLGNFGVGKSSLIRPAAEVPGPVMYTTHSDSPGWVILGSGIGADSLSSVKKVDAMEPVLAEEEINLISAGVYYAKIIDLDRYADADFNIYVVHLKTSEKSNRERIEGRGGKWNQTTYDSTVKHQANFMAKALCDGHEVVELDNERTPKQVRDDFETILDEILYGASL